MKYLSESEIDGRSTFNEQTHALSHTQANTNCKRPFAWGEKKRGNIIPTYLVIIAHSR